MEHPNDQVVILNGRRSMIRAGSTVAELRSQLGVPADDVILKQEGGSFRPLTPHETIVEKDKLTSQPPVAKGAPEPGVSAWLARDLDLLRDTLGGRSVVSTKAIERGGVPYLAVEVTNVRLNERKFNRTAGKFLLLLPQRYPAIPPIGVYINYPYQLQPGLDDHHLTGDAYYGAPDLRPAGWHWYCLRQIGAAAWRPGARPEDGHNLLTIYSAASYAVNN